jgi:hypothetical protein
MCFSEVNVLQPYPLKMDQISFFPSFFNVQQKYNKMFKTPQGMFAFDMKINNSNLVNERRKIASRKIQNSLLFQFIGLFNKSNNQSNVSRSLRGLTRAVMCDK